MLIIITGDCDGHWSQIIMVIWLPAILLMFFAYLCKVLHDSCPENRQFHEWCLYYKCDCQILFSFLKYNAYPWYSHDKHRDLYCISLGLGKAKGVFLVCVWAYLNVFSSRGNPTFVEVPDKTSHLSSHKRGSEGTNSYSLKTELQQVLARWQC